MYGKMQVSVLTEFFLSPFTYIPKISGASPISLFTILLAFPQLLSNPHGGWEYPLGLQFGEPSFTFGGQKLLMAVPFLVY